MNELELFALLYSEIDDGAERAGFIAGILAAFPIDEMASYGYADPWDFKLAIMKRSNELLIEKVKMKKSK